MKLLLDTQAMIWWFNDDPRLGPRARAAISDKGNTVWVSAASFWEVSIKHRIGKLDECGSGLMDEALASGFCVVPIESGHLKALESFESASGHNDPFDLIILIQARAIEAMLITSDRQMRKYDVRCL